VTAAPKDPFGRVPREPIEVPPEAAGVPEMPREVPVNCFSKKINPGQSRPAWRLCPACCQLVPADVSITRQNGTTAVALLCPRCGITIGGGP